MIKVGTRAVGAVDHLQASDGAAGLKDAGTPAEMLAPLLAAWNSGTAYAAGAITFDRGGIWQATGTNTNSRPISGNTDWTLIGGTPYVDVVLDPVDLTTAPFYTGGPVGYQVIPAPGAGLLALPVSVLTATGDGEDWGDNIELIVGWTIDGALETANLEFQFSPWLLGIVDPDKNPFYCTNGGVLNDGGNSNILSAVNKPVAIGTIGDITAGTTFGTRSVRVRIHYTIEQQAVDAGATFYLITDLNQGSKTFTVTDADEALDGATGTIEVVGSTGNDDTYTIVSAVSGAGDTVITVVEAIPDATADGWVKQ